MPPTPRHRLRTSHALVLVALSLTIVMGACGGDGGDSATETTSDTPATSPTPVATIPAGAAALAATAAPEETEPATDEATEAAGETASAPPALDPAALQAGIDALVAGVGGLTAVEIEEPDGTALASTNAGEQVEAASLYKLAIMVEAYRQRDVGMLTFDDEVVLQDYHFAEGGDIFSEEEVGTTTDVATLLDSMITVSSNVAATALLEYVGTDNVNETMASLGLTSTEIRWYPGPTGAASEWSRTLLGVRPDLRADEALNVTSAADVAALFRMLLAGEVVSAEASAEMLDLLARQQINDRLPAYLPEGTVVAHKTGNLDGLMHDAGVIYAPAGPVIVVVMTEDLDEVTSTDLIAQIGLLAYETHQ